MRLCALSVFNIAVNVIQVLFMLKLTLTKTATVLMLSLIFFCGFILIKVKTTTCSTGWELYQLISASAHFIRLFMDVRRFTAKLADHFEVWNTVHRQAAFKRRFHLNRRARSRHRWWFKRAIKRLSKMIDASLLKPDKWFLASCSRRIFSTGSAFPRPFLPRQNDTEAVFFNFTLIRRPPPSNS